MTISSTCQSFSMISASTCVQVTQTHGRNGMGKSESARRICTAIRPMSLSRALVMSTRIMGGLCLPLPLELVPSMLPSRLPRRLGLELPRRGLLLASVLPAGSTVLGAREDGASVLPVIRLIKLLRRTVFLGLGSTVLAARGTVFLPLGLPLTRLIRLSRRTLLGLGVGLTALAAGGMLSMSELLPLPLMLPPALPLPLVLEPPRFHCQTQCPFPLPLPFPLPCPLPLPLIV